MPDRHGKLTADERDEQNTVNGSIGRRRLLKIGGAGIALGALTTVGSAGANTRLANSIVIDGTVSPETATYEFFTSGDVALHPDVGSNDDSGSIQDGHVNGSVGNEIHAYRFSGTLSYLDVDGNAELTLNYGDSGTSDTDRLEIVASSDGSVDYEITSSGTVEKVLDNGDRSANEGEDTVAENDDGTWTVVGSTANGYGDTYDFHGDIERFDPVTGEFTLFFNGVETTVPELTGQEEPADEEEATIEREHWYSFEATGDEYADYYLEVEDGGEIIPSLVDDAVIDYEYFWIGDDGTKAAGRVFPGETHAYAFDTLVADVTIEGEANPTVDDSDSNLEYYPRSMASGDHWKGYFPWHLEGEQREHWYSFEATGDEYADYYLEVEDGGEIIPSLVDDAVIDYEYFWIGDDGTKAAGRVFPGETHAYAFDTLVADVTIEGEANPTVDDSDSNLEYYPRSMASGDHWKTGFPWQDDDHEAPGDGIVEGGPIGGGQGYENTISPDEADVVVSSRSEFNSALSSASSGDVVYVAGDASIDLGSNTYTVPRGVTLASDRGIDNAPGGHLYTDHQPDSSMYYIELSRGARLCGVRVQGPYYDFFDPDFYATGAGVTVRGDSVEIDNCEMWGFALASVHVGTGEPHIHHNDIHHNPRRGLGYGVVNYGGNPLIEWNYFDANRHSVACDGQGGYVARYNHFGPITYSHVMDVHSPGGTRVEIYNNTVEAVDGDHDGDQRPAVAIRGAPDDVAAIYDNWFYNPDEPLDTPDGWSTRHAIIQVGVDEWTNVEWSGNHYGSSEPANGIGHPR